MKTMVHDDELLWKEFEAAVDESDRRREIARRDSDLRNDPEFIFEFMKGCFAQGVFAAMRRQGINESQLAEKLGMTRQAVNQTLSMKGNLSMRTLAKFSVALGLRVEDRFIEIGSERPVRIATEKPKGTRAIRAPRKSRAKAKPARKRTAA